MLASALHYSEFALGLVAARLHKGYSDPEATILDQLRHREFRFLELLRSVVFERPKHPLHQMMLEARCSYVDIESGISRKGLESTLELLCAAGVFVSADELKAEKQLFETAGISRPRPPTL